MTSSWKPLLDMLVSSSWERLIVIGAPDRGKSTFCDALLRALDANGLKASLLDTALGEKLAGLPACLTLAHLEAGRYHIDDLYFAGSFETAKRMATIVSGAARLAARTTSRLVIDTSGTVNAPGRALKSLKIDALRPDHIVAIGLDEELEPFLALKPQNIVHRLPSGDGVQPRNFMTRALGRLQAFEAVFSNAASHVLQDLAVEQWDDGAFDWANGEYICGLADQNGQEHGLGILTFADPASRTFRITTTVAADRIHRIRVGMPLPDELKT